MLNINVICVGKIKEDYLKSGINEYLKRLSKYCSVEIIELQDEKIPENLSIKQAKAIKDKEGQRIIKALKKGSFNIALDLNGKEYTSEEFSKRIGDISLYGSLVTFIIGGTLGLSDDVLNLVDEKICFSKLTFPHQLIRLFLLEQLFRSFKINNGETYHR